MNVRPSWCERVSTDLGGESKQTSPAGQATPPQPGDASMANLMVSGSATP